MGSGCDVGNHLDRNCCSDNFVEFVEKVIQKYPGICSKTFEIFVGSRGSEIEYIGKYEHLCENLIAALYAAGEEFDEDAIRRCPPKEGKWASGFHSVVHRVLLRVEIVPRPLYRGNPFPARLPYLCV